MNEPMTSRADDPTLSAAERARRALSLVPELEAEQGLVALAAEAARWVPGLDDATTRGWVALLVCLFVAERGGSTRLGLDAGPGSWRAEAERLALPGPWVGDLERVVGALRGEAAHPLHALVGAAPRPFVLLAGGRWLGTRALVGAEESLEAGLAARLASGAARDPESESELGLESDLVSRGAEVVPLPGAAAARAGLAPFTRPSAAAVEAALALLDAHPTPTSGGARPLVGAQRAAVARALASPLTIVTGGPGTGKTTVAVSIVRALVAAGLAPGRIGLAAPTGKAQDRLRRALDAALATLDATPADRALRATRPRAQTLHRLLERGGGDATALRGRLPLDALIVDEGSMIDVALMDALVSALPPSARLVVLGDRDQLPSVDAGAVLRDWVERADVAPVVVELTESHRMSLADAGGAEIYGVAQRVRVGDVRVVDALTVRDDARALTRRGVEWVSASPLRPLLEAWVAAELPRAALADAEATFGVHEGRVTDADAPRARRLLALHDRARILTVTRAGLGLDRVNAGVRAIVAAETRGLALKSAQGLRMGEPVIVERNAYALGLYNGDVGVVALARGDGARGSARPEVVLLTPGEGDAIRALPLAAVRSALAPAYALTVHKAQGSEYERVMVILPDRISPLLTREVIYTALTRARRGVVLVGARDKLTRAIERRLERTTAARSAR
jgi:exodeoxyribonuclease V alpha subunit